MAAKRRAFGKKAPLPVPLDLSNPDHRQQAMRQYLWFDHAILRTFWTNFYEIAPGVYRSNQPSAKRLHRYAAMGIKTVINLRGHAPNKPSYEFEKEGCAAAGLRLIDLSLNARAAPNPAVLLELISLFRTLDRPFMFHCKSGADRASLASAVYLMVIQGKPVERAKRMLGLRYLHLKWTKTGILDYFLDVYAARNADAPIAFEDWLRHEYDPKTLLEGFKNGRKLPE